jgi:hypothetical protein
VQRKHASHLIGDSHNEDTGSIGGFDAIRGIFENDGRLFLDL